MKSKDTDRPGPEMPGGVWPPAPQGTPPAPSAPPHRRILMGVRLDAALGVPLGVVAGALLAAAVIILEGFSCDRRWVIASGIATLVNMAACLAVGRRFRALGVSMAIASSATILALLWYFWQFMSMCGDGLNGGDGSEKGAGE